MVVDFNGGGFDRVDFAETTAAASIIDTIDPTAVFISTRNISEGEADVAYTISLAKLPQTDAMVTVSILLLGMHLLLMLICWLWPRNN